MAQKGETAWRADARELGTCGRARERPGLTVIEEMPSAHEHGGLGAQPIWVQVVVLTDLACAGPCW